MEPSTDDGGTEQARNGRLRGLLDLKAIVNGAIGSAIIASVGVVWKFVGWLFGSFPGPSWRTIAVGAVAALWLGFGLLMAFAWRRPDSEPPRPKPAQRGAVQHLTGLVLLGVYGGSVAVWAACWAWPIEYGLLPASGCIIGLVCFFIAAINDRRLFVNFAAALLAVVSGLPAAAPVVAHLGGWPPGVLVTLLPVEILLIGYLLISLILLPTTIAERLRSHRS